MTDYDKIFLQRTHAIEKKFVLSIRKAIAAYRSSFIDDLRQHGQPAALASLSPLSEHITPLLLDIYHTAGLFGARFTHAETSRLARQKSGAMGRADEWIKLVMDYLRLHMIEMTARISDTMRADIVKILEEGVDKGWSFDDIVLKLKEEGLIEARARVIARTEVIRAANVGHQVAAQTLPFEVDKRWSAAQDHRTRHSHRAIHGHQTDEHGTFQVPVYKGDTLLGVEEMQRPGDPNASASNTINCRCRVQFIPKRDTQGNLLYRRADTAQIIPLRTPATVIPAHQIAAILKQHIRVRPDMGEQE